MKQKQIKPKTKQNRSHWGKQATVSEGVLCSEVAPELNSPTVAHCYGGKRVTHISLASLEVETQS